MDKDRAEMAVTREKRQGWDERCYAAEESYKVGLEYTIDQIIWSNRDPALIKLRT